MTERTDLFGQRVGVELHAAQAGVEFAFELADARDDDGEPRVGAPCLRVGARDVAVGAREPLDGPTPRDAVGHPVRRPDSALLSESGGHLPLATKVRAVSMGLWGGRVGVGGCPQFLKAVHFAALVRWLHPASSCKSERSCATAC